MLHISFLRVAVAAVSLLFGSNLFVEERDTLVQFEGYQWVAKNTHLPIKTTYRGHTALQVVAGAGGWVFLRDIEFRTGRIELDVASQRRTMVALCLGSCECEDPDQNDQIAVMLCPKRNGRSGRRLRQATITNAGQTDSTYAVVGVCADESGDQPDLACWIHLRLELSNERCEVYVNGDKRPAFVTNNVFNLARGARVGVCNSCYIKNVRVQPDSSCLDHDD